MITLHVTGGLGNQLFNYAAARSLADRGNTNLIVDAAAFKGARSSRPFSLEEFPSIRAEIRNSNTTLCVKRSFVSRIRRKIEEDLLATKVQRHYEEVGYFEGFETFGRRVVLKGHYIDRQFFNWNEERILADLALPSDFLARRQDTQGEAAHAEIHKRGVPVSVHVRRGDFLMPHAQWLLLSKIENYYYEAMNQIKGVVGDEVYFWVFSDDLGWCRQTFREYPFQIQYVDQFSDSAINPMREFFLMSTCRHHIIANSGFSLWSSILAGKNKLIVSPYKWDRDGKVDIGRIVPDGIALINW